MQSPRFGVRLISMSVSSSASAAVIG